MRSATHPFPVLRWCALVWMLVWLPAYVHTWGWANLLHLCDVAVFLSAAGVWLGNRLLLSSQALGCIAPGIFWLVDVGGRLATGRFPLGGTAYMFDPRYPLGVRLLPTFHLFLPLLLLYAVRKVGYDRRAFALQSGIAASLLIVSRFLSADLNVNYAYRDPLWHHAWAPAPLHVFLILLAILGAIYLPTHIILRLVWSKIPFAENEKVSERLQAVRG